MDNDLRDALIAWQGGELPGGRTEALFARMRDDAEFRRALASEVWALSLTRIAQAPEPRWLALQEELGLGEPKAASTETARETRLMEAIRQAPVRFVDAWWRWVAYGSMAAAAAFAVIALPWRHAPIPPAAAPENLAVLIQAENVKWREGTPHRFATGEALAPGRLQLASGRVSLLFTSGVTLDFEGPADLDLVTGDRVVCREGRLRTRVPHGAEGFCVETPGGAVTDLGTELGVSVLPDGQTHVAVFEGKAEVSLKIPGQDGVRTALLGAQQSAELLPRTGEIRTDTRESFLQANQLRLPILRLGSDYAETVRAAAPLLYWRLNRLEGTAVPNEITGGPALRLAGGAAIQPDESGQASAIFPGKSAPGALYLDEPWQKPAAGHAIEFWFATNSTDLMAVAALTAAETDKSHIALVELATRRPGLNPEPGILRYLLRWPASARGGVNIFSSPKAFPYQWHHVVAQQAEGALELFIDGESAGKAEAAQFPREANGLLQFGCLEFRPEGNPARFERPFAGRMAEIAIYGRVLTPEEIRQHAGLRKSR